MVLPGERVSAVVGHLNPTKAMGRASLLMKNPDDIVITLAIRTPFTKARKGGLKDTRLDDLLVAILTATRERSNIDLALIEDICVGNVLVVGQAYIARSAVLAAGFLVSTTALVCNRFCSSGLLAMQNIANQIIGGLIDVGLVVGAKSISSTPDNGPPNISAKIINCPIASQNTQPMGQTSENVAGQFYGAIGSGLEPRIMGIGPTIAIPKILEKTGLTSLDVDVFEINKAFASMGVYCIEKLGLDLAKVNPRGGAISFGRPLGCTGAR